MNVKEQNTSGAAELAVTPLLHGEEKTRTAGKSSRGFGRFSDRLRGLLNIPAPDAPTLLYRIRVMERDIVLPLKAAGIGVLIFSFYFTPWIGMTLSTLDIAIETTQYFFWLYVGVNVLFALLLLRMNWVSVAVLEWSVFTICLVDGIFLSTLTLLVGAHEVVLLLFLAQIIRGAVSVPRPTSQLTLNLTLSACYVLAGGIEIALAGYLEEPESALMEISNHPAEELLLRLVVMLFMTFCCYTVQVLLQRQRQTYEQARELAVREAQLQSSARLAAEFAHQIKNPLGIINNAAFSLQRWAGEQGRAAEQIRIIQEEVQRSDKLITEVMGYAQLNEGRVEKLNVAQEIDHALSLVFPPGADYPTRIERDYAVTFPPLLMQRRHLTDMLVNVLQNAREALGEKGGAISIRGRSRGDYSIEVSIQDSGPGIAPEKLEKIFEPYYTTKEKGTGLGLATVKHNVEMYGGSVRVESELGKGARFILLFSARTLLRLEKQ